MEAANIHGVHACPKGIRHGFAIHGISSGVPLSVVSELLGHTSIETTMIYTLALGEEKVRLVRKMWEGVRS